MADKTQLAEHIFDIGYEYDACKVYLNTPWPKYTAQSPKGRLW